MEAIAIIGLGVRLPGAKNPECFWHLLSKGIDAITEVPSERWNVNEFYDARPATPGKMISRYGGFLDQVDKFEPSFFGISPREAQRIDPQQRLVLEVAWEALENAGIAPDKLSGSQTGVFIGIGNYDYGKLQSRNLSGLDAYDGPGATLGIAANRLSYVLNLHGPSLVVETSCSSSLVAIHYACQSLRTKESNLCLVGGVSLILSPDSNIIFSQAKMMAADGRCKTFDASADGYVRGEGCGVIVLKCLSEALKDGDNILATIKGSAINQDGLSNGLTAPNGPSQQAVIRKALENAGVAADQISYVEAHGTGTPLGDPIEVNSLKAVLMQGRHPNQPCYIGSVKTNIGHLEPAAGIAGIIKVVLSLQNKEIPPHLHFKRLNPYIKIENTPFTIPTELKKWIVDQVPRLAGVSSFGFGGTNAHVILEEALAPVLAAKNTKLSQHLLTISAKTEKSLQELAKSYEAYLESHPGVSLEDLCYTANTGRSHFNHRLAIIISDKQELADKLAKITAEKEANNVFSAKHSSNSKSPKIAFLFTGQGSQYINMGRQLYETKPVFRQSLDQCEQILQPYLEKSILDVIYPQDTKELNSPVIDQTAYTQPALFAIEYALFQLWKSWGIKPDVVMGHSVGEYVAATVAGVFSLEDGLKLIAHRGRLMQDLPDGGEMLAVMASEEKVNQLIAPYTEKLAIAAINGPVSVVISGEAEAIRTVRDSLNAEGIKTNQLQVSHAFHSPLMEAMMRSFEEVANKITYNQPQISLISNVTETRTHESITTASYWVNHVRQPVNFAQSMEVLHQEGYEIFLEIGPKPILLGMGRECLIGTKKLWLPSLRPGKPDWLQMLQSLGQLYVQGVKVDWLGFNKDYSCQKVVLPTYPWQRRSYWISDIQDKNKHKSSVRPEEEKTRTDGNMESRQIQTNENQILQQPKQRLSDPELLSFPKALLRTEETPKVQLDKLTVQSVQVEPAKSTQQQVESGNIAQTRSISPLDNFDDDIAQIKHTLKESLASVLYTDISEIEDEQKFIDLGLDSIVGVEWITVINQTYNLNIKATKLYDHPTLSDLAKYIIQEISSKGGGRLPQNNQDYPKKSLQKQDSPGDSLQDMRQTLRLILNKVANHELTPHEANKIIQQIKQKRESSNKCEDNGTNKNPIFQLIKKNIYKVEPELETVSLKTTDSLKKLGIDSVNRAEILMMVMEELDFYIPLIELAGAQNIGELADVIAAKLEAHRGI